MAECPLLGRTGHDGGIDVTHSGHRDAFADRVLRNIWPGSRGSLRPDAGGLESVSPAGANGTITRTGRVGYACAQPMRDTAGSAAAPAARCKNARRGSFMASPL